MEKTTWKPWHEVVRLRDDLKSGELSLSIFAADLYDVVMGKAKPVYQDPREFFSLTYPTFNLRELAKDVLLRLAGRNDKAVRQLELTYGGGKTHTLIALYHLVSEPAGLPDLPAIREFTAHAGITPPKARVAAMAFDKLDVEKGMEVIDPEGNKRWLKEPWSVLAWQIAGQAGIRLLNADGKDEERESAPAENLLSQLLSLPEGEGLATLVLIDEVLMYAREKVSLDPLWRGRLQNFFQYLTQAATKVSRCAIVVSLLASDPRKSDALGKEIAKDLYDIFRREQEEGIQPVEKADVAEVLRRRFFKPESIKDHEAFRSHVVTALSGIVALDEQTKREEKSAEERFIGSYPFHPDLTEVFYTKWTQLEGFQRTRGVLRTFAAALREAEKWDDSPLVGANAFLSAPTVNEISDAARELTNIAASEEYEGKKQEWAGILQGELSKAKSIQDEYPGLRHREIEQAVFATFIHSQPIGQKALTRELLVLLGHTHPDRIELEKALRRWTEVSWFLDEGSISDAPLAADGGTNLPRSWRLGSRPNLTQMHSSACLAISPDAIDAKVLESISAAKSLTANAAAAGARVHNLPTRPHEVADDGEFHYAVLGPKAACVPGNPSVEARRFLDETTGSDKPRVNRNAVVLAVPSRDGLDIIRSRVREYLGWEEVRTMLSGQQVDPLRTALLAGHVEGAKKKIPEAVRQAYCVVVTVSEKNEAEAFRLTVGTDPLFGYIKADKRARIQETAVDARALLPEGPYSLWQVGETSRRAKDLAGAFAQFVRLPKMLRPKAVLDTLAQGAKEGIFVLRVTRPDKSVRTIWREEPLETDLNDPTLEVVLPEAASLSSLRSDQLIPRALPQLWPDPPALEELRVQDLLRYFAGRHTVKVDVGGWLEPLIVPSAEKTVVDAAIADVVRAGKLWLTSGVASILGESIPTGVLTGESILQRPPQPIPAMGVLPPNLPEAWSGQETTALAIASALSQRATTNLPWVTVSEAIDGAIRARYLEPTVDSGPWPCGLAGAGAVKLRMRQTQPGEIPHLPVARPGTKAAEAELLPHQIQDLADVMSELVEAAMGLELKMKVQIELSGKKPLAEEVVARIDGVLSKVSEDLRLK